MPRPLPLLALLLVLLTAGCGDADYRPFASGAESEVLAVVDSSAWRGIVGEALRDVVGANVQTLPSPESGYSVTAATLTSQSRLEEVRTRKNVVIAASLADTSVEARLIKAFFSEDAQAQLRAAGRGAAVTRPDLWRRAQQVVFITAPDDSTLAATIRERARFIQNAFESAVRSRLEVDMFERGRQEDTEEMLMERHGFAVNVQHDYFIARDTTQFVWLRRVLTDTWRSLYVFYIDDFDQRRLDSAFVVGLRDSLTTAHITGSTGGYVQIDQRLPLVVEPVDFLGRENAYEMRGVWVMRQPRPDGTTAPTMAGPFVNYTFYDPPSRRLYSIDGMVFAPNYTKLPFVRHMDVIAHTFRTQKATSVQQRAPDAAPKP